MYSHYHLSDDPLLLAVLFLVALLALILMLTVRPGKPASPRQHYASDFDHGSFRDLGIIALLLLPFIIIYLLKHWVS